MWGPLNSGDAGRPVDQISFAINYAIHGANVTGYHVTNLLLHVCASLVLFGIVRRTLTSPRLVQRIGATATALSLAVALLWQVHPLLSDSVTYISGRTEILGGLFLLLTLYCVIRGAADTKLRSLWHVGAVASCALGAGCKEIMVAAPPLVLLYDWLFVSGSFRQAFRSRRLLYAALFATLVIIPLDLYMANFHRSALVVRDPISSWDYVKIQSRVLTLYLRLSFWPDPLIIDYAGAFASHPTLASVLPQAVLVLALLVLTALGLWRRLPIAFAGAWFFLILAPTSSLLPLPTEIATERRMYLPLMAVVVIVVIGAWDLLRHLNLNARLVYGVAGALGCAVAAVEVQRTLWRNEDYKDPVSLWADVIQHIPRNSRAYSNLGYHFLMHGDDANAKTCFVRAVEIDPAAYIDLNNLASIYVREGNEAAAVESLNRVIAIRPDYAVAYVNFGILHYEHGRYDEAERFLRHAYELQPARTDHLLALAKVQVARGQLNEAEQTCGQLIHLNPQLGPAHDWLSVVLARTARGGEAVKGFANAIRLDVDDRDSKAHLAWLMATSPDASVHDPKQALMVASRAAEETNRKGVLQLDALGVTLAVNNRFADAAQVAKLALDAAKARGSPRVPRIERRLAAYEAMRLPPPALLELDP
jgi:Flp pilus assembly protein TadD